MSHSPSMICPICGAELCPNTTDEILICWNGAEPDKDGFVTPHYVTSQRLDRELEVGGK